MIKQIEACVSDLGCDAVKTGMLANAEIINAVAAAISEHRLGPLVVDPVMIAKSGASLLNSDAIEALKAKLLSLATVVKRNLHEARALTGRDIKTVAQRFSGGVWKLRTIYEALYTPALSQHATEADWKALLQHLEHWKSAQPKSVTATVALGGAYVNYAWDARGSGVSGTVKQSGWNLFEDRLATGEKILEDAVNFPDKCPEWYFLMKG